MSREKKETQALEAKVQEVPLGQQDLQGRVGLEAQGPLALLDRGVHPVTWGCLDHKVLPASLDTATPLHVLPTGWELPILTSRNSLLSKMSWKPWNCGALGSDSLMRNSKTNCKTS